MIIVQRLTYLGVAACLLISVAQAPGAEAEPDSPVFDIPRVEGIKVDGKPGDWSDCGFRVDALCGPVAMRKDAADFDATFRLAWDDRGLLLLVTVSDDVIFENPDDPRQWSVDSLDVFLASGLGAQDIWSANIAPGLGPKGIEPRVLFTDRRSEELKHVKLTATAARTKTATGYVMEVLLPWKNLAIKPALGREVAFQIYVRDRDGLRGACIFLWYPQRAAHKDTTKMHRLRLADKAGAPVTSAVWSWYEGLRRVLVNVNATVESGGKVFQVLDGGKVLKEGKLVPDGRIAKAGILLPMPALGKAYGPLSVTIDGRKVATINLPDPAPLRQEAFARENLTFQPCVFGGEQFPPVEFEHPSFVEDYLIGPYTLKATFYDRKYNEVTRATKAGRYGAIVEIKPQHGPSTRRFLTLFRQAETFEWYEVVPSAKIELPEQIGIDPAVVREQSQLIAEHLKWTLRDSFDRGPGAAILLACLYETKPGAGKLPRRLAPWSVDDKWWHELKRRTGLAPLRYFVQLPEGAEKDKTKRYPTILFLHGRNNQEPDPAQLATFGPAKFVRTHKDFPFIVVMPACPGGKGGWRTLPLDDLLKEVVAKYPIDPDRIYLTGASMGGYGSWRLASEYPKRFAAVVPVCGSGDPLDAGRLKDVPIWVFHGDADMVVSIEHSYKMVEALRKVKGRVRFTAYPDVGHNSWTPTYANDELYKWMLCQKRGRPEQAPATMPGTAPSD